MKLRLEEIAPLHKPLFGTSRRARGTKPGSRTRREFLRDAMIVGTSIGVASLGVFPPARRARADHGAWQIWSGCSGLGSWVDDDNCDGCNGGPNQPPPSRIFCCCTSGGYHKGSGAGCNYLHRPNECKDSYYDGWTWTYGGCCVISGGVCRSSQTWRCSDGYYRSNCSNAFSKSICRYRTSDGNGCAPCPEMPSRRSRFRPNRVAV
jgi:hypothetical protein